MRGHRGLGGVALAVMLFASGCGGATATPTAPATATASEAATATATVGESPTATATPTPTPTASPTAAVSSFYLRPWSIAPTKTPTPKPPAAGNSVVVTPDTVSCSAEIVTTRITITLDGSLPGTMIIKPFIDSDVGTSTTIGAAFNKQSDGSWRESETITSTQWCSHYGVGGHVFGVQDESGRVIVQSTITLTA